MKDTITYAVDADIELHGTSKKVTINATFSGLLELFGEPLKVEDGDHVRYHWPVQFSDGGIMDVYDWNDDRRIEDVTDWNVGGKDFMTAGRIYDILANRPIIA
jgi:hypothetical protein